MASAHSMHARVASAQSASAQIASEQAATPSATAPRKGKTVGIYLAYAPP